MQFHQLSNLAPEEVSLTLLADNWIKIKARTITKTVHYEALGLANRHNRTLNKQAGILLALTKKKILPNDNAHAKAISRLRTIFKDRLGVTSDPFEPHWRNAGWSPRFEIMDNTNVQDERAMRRATRVEFNDDLMEHTRQNQPHHRDDAPGDVDSFWRDDDENDSYI